MCVFSSVSLKAYTTAYILSNLKLIANFREFYRVFSSASESFREKIGKKNWKQIYFTGIIVSLRRKLSIPSAVGTMELKYVFE